MRSSTYPPNASDTISGAPAHSTIKQSVICILILGLVVFTRGTLEAALSSEEAQALAHRFRPYLKTSLDPVGVPEPFHPCDWQWLVAHCTLTSNDVLVYTPEELAADPAKLIEPYNANLTNSEDSLKSDCGYALHLIDQSSKGGQSWADVKNGHGIYAHVEEIDDALVNIEYTILWAYNLGFFSLHDGDVTTMMVVYDRRCGQLARLSYSIHGAVLETFRISHPSQIRFVDLPGLDENFLPAIVHAEELEITGDDEYQVGPSWHDPCRPAIVYLAQDPASLRYEHPLAYAEWGAHELWSAPCGAGFGLANHDGLGVSFLPNSIQFLGSVRNPTPEHIPFIYYNGKLGTDPNGLMLHGTWYWPEYPLTAYQIPKNRFADPSPYKQASDLEFNYLRWPPFHECGGPDLYFVDWAYSGQADGCGMHPYTTIAQGLSQVPPGNIIRVAAGAYSENVVMSLPSRFEAYWGNVVIGTPK